jgi:hypothetical protein
MSSTRDTNWKSYVGPKDNGRTVQPSDWVNPVNPKDYDDILKCSNVHGFTADWLRLPASREDSIDCVRGRKYHFARCAVHGSTTLKGAIDGFSFYRCLFAGTIELGQYDNYWYPGRPPTRDGMIEQCESIGGLNPIRIKLWDATAPVVYRSNVKITVIPKAVWFPYFLFRYFLNRGWRFRGK